MAVDTAVASGTVADDDDVRPSLMTSGTSPWMNLGFFGVQFSFGLTQTAVNPIFLLLGRRRTTCRSSTSRDRSPVCSSSRSSAP
jgi:maltose/moltooligosaccharide transporter